MRDLRENDNHTSELDTGGIARMLLGTFEVGVFGHEIGNRRITKLSREIIFELFDMNRAREDDGKERGQSPAGLVR